MKVVRVIYQATRSSKVTVSAKLANIREGVNTTNTICNHIGVLVNTVIEEVNNRVDKIFLRK